MADLFSNATPTLTSPAMDGEMVTPSDAASLQQVTRAVYVGNGGTLAAEMASGAQVSLANVPGGALLPLRLRAIRSTGTTASGLVALW